MNAIQWEASLSVGEEALDADHQELVRLLNAVAACGPYFAEVFSALIDYTTRHFEREEDHLARIGYPELERHRGLHDAFVARLTRMLAAHADDALAPADAEVAEMLWDWLRTHILVEDRKYADFASRR
ncbi:MAG: bacteriohemerythrin [Pseudomonadota bacterium]